jgi:hypothetical protein
MGRRRRERQLDLDFGERRRWKELPLETRRECIELLSLLLAGIVRAERVDVEEVLDERR